MKKLIFICLIVLSVNGFSQIDTTSLSYYPLNEGDYWEYAQIVEDWLYPPGGSIVYYSYEVIGDSLLHTGKIYKIIKKTKLDTSQSRLYLFERIDSVTCNVYRYEKYDSTEYLIDSLKSQIGDSCRATRTFPFQNHKTICDTVILDSLLNRIIVSKVLIEKHWHSPIEYKLSKGFGLTYLNYYFDIGTFTQHLLYARINGIEYGTRVNSLERENNPQIASEFHLYQNYPNPFNSTTIISFELPQKSEIELSVFDINGRRIKTLLSDEFTKGKHKISWDGTNVRGEQVSSGVYIFSIKAIYNNQSVYKSGKMILLQ